MSRQQSFLTLCLLALVILTVVAEADADSADVLNSGGSANNGIAVNAGRTTLTYTVDDSWPEALTLSLDCAGNLQLSGEGGTLATLDPASVGHLTLRGDDRDNSLTVDFANGNPIPAGGLVFDGVNRGTDFDVLRVVNAKTQSLVSKAVNGHDGTLEYAFADNAVATLEYRNIEPVDMTGSTATDLVLNLPSGNDNAELLDVGGGVLRLQSTDATPTFEETSFVAPSGSLTINGGQGDDVISVTGLGSGFAANFNINGGDGFDTFIVSGGLSLNANLSVDLEVVTLSDSVAAGGGNIVIATDMIAIGAGVSSSGGFVIYPSTAGTSIGLGGGSGTLNLDDAELAYLLDGFSAITIGDIFSGPIDILSVTLRDDLTLISNVAFTDGTGLDLSTPSVTLFGNVSPGQSPGVLNVEGDFTLGMDSSLVVEVGGASPGDTSGSHDQVDVTGAVTIGSNVTLQLISWGGFMPSGSEQLVIISNDSSDAVTGTFAGLAEGATVPNLLGSGLDAMITYQGGDGNDVVIVVDVPVELQTFTIS